MVATRASMEKRETGMTKIHAQIVGDNALISRSELERLVELARRSEQIHIETQEDDIPTLAIMRLAERCGAFDFWKDEGENVYSEKDGTPV